MKIGNLGQKLADIEVESFVANLLLPEKVVEEREKRREVLGCKWVVTGYTITYSVTLTPKTFC